jgi:hypothetical protein
MELPDGMGIDDRLGRIEGPVDALGSAISAVFGREMGNSDVWDWCSRGSTVRRNMQDAKSRVVEVRRRERITAGWSGSSTLRSMGPGP